MPRRTHPRPRRKHSRAHARYHRDRYIEKRWRQAKERYGDEFWFGRMTQPGPVTDEDIRVRHALGALGPVVTMHPEAVARLPRWVQCRYPVWPFSLERGRFARNPFNTCGCVPCHWDKLMEPRRAREKRDWRRMAESQT